MNKIDLVLPHRLLINQSLRKEAEKLREQINQYNEKYEIGRHRILKEVEETKKQLDERFEIVKRNAEECLATEKQEISLISDAISEYAFSYFSRELAYKKKEAFIAQINGNKEYIHFLTAQMREIGTEVDLLQKRISILSQDADISDILQLICSSGCAIEIDGIHNATELLDVVVNQSELYFEKNRILWNTLQNLKKILEQRTSFLAEIHYISWVREQKIQLSKELSKARNNLRMENKELKDNQRKLSNDVIRLNSAMLENARIIRFYWAKPTVHIGTDIEKQHIKKAELQQEIKEYEEELKPLYKDHKITNEEIERMKIFHSKDSFKWDMLQKELNDCTEKINRIKADKNRIEEEIETIDEDIKALINRRTKWYGKQSIIENMLEDQSISLMRIGPKDKSDALIYAEARINELSAIFEKSKEEAIYKLEAQRTSLSSKKHSLLKEKESETSIYLNQLEEAKKELEAASVKHLLAEKTALSNAKKKEALLKKRLAEQQKVVADRFSELIHARNTDNRFFLIRLISESDEEMHANELYSSAIIDQRNIEGELLALQEDIKHKVFRDDPVIVKVKDDIDAAQLTIDTIISNQITCENAINKKISDIDSQLDSLKPIPEHPTVEERIEMENLQLWRNEHEKRATANQKKNNQRRHRQ